MALSALLSGSGRYGFAQEGSAKTSSQETRGVEHLRQLLAQPFAAGWQGATLVDVRRVEQRKDVTFATGLPPVWVARLAGPEGRGGYMMWEAQAGGGLLEFALDGPVSWKGDGCHVVSGVPALQQFPLTQNGARVASGCVPTAGASLPAFWIGKGYPAWKGAVEGDLLQALTRRLRDRLEMQIFPDKDGFTSDGMSLAGAMPDALARALQADAKAHGVPMQATVQAFDFPAMKKEIQADRPVLLSCVVRVPQKPELSWGHEVAGVGCLIALGGDFAGVLDNFFPMKHPGTIRWIRRDAFSTLITVSPEVAK